MEVVVRILQSPAHKKNKITNIQYMNNVIIKIRTKTNI